MGCISSLGGGKAVQGVLKVATSLHEAYMPSTWPGEYVYKDERSEESTIQSEKVQSWSCVKKHYNFGGRKTGSI